METLYYMSPKSAAPKRQYHLRVGLKDDVSTITQDSRFDCRHAVHFYDGRTPPAEVGVASVETLRRDARGAYICGGTYPLILDINV